VVREKTMKTFFERGDDAGIVLMSQPEQEWRDVL